MSMSMERSPVMETEQRVRAVLPDSKALPLLRHLQKEIANDYYTIVTVGEFKHGKSTVVNALLGGDWMPTDVTPTTALIHAVFYGETPEIHIIRKGHQPEIRPLEALGEYSADALHTDGSIDHIKLFVPSPLLKERVVLVDTPGLNELNTDRSAITESFIPRADAVLFTLDLRSPLNETEYVFLENLKEKQGIDTMLFIANFMDAIEEDELEDTVDYIERRLSGLQVIQPGKVLPVSAKAALTGKLQRNADLLNSSNIRELEKRLQTILVTGDRQTAKQRRNKFRLQILREQACREAEEQLAILNADMETLAAQHSSIASWLNSQDEWKTELDEYIDERRQEIENIAMKSLYYYVGKLKKQVANRITTFNGNDIDHFVNTELPMAVQNGFEGWLDQYAIHFRELFVKLEIELTKGLSQAFEQHVRVSTNGFLEMGDHENTASTELHYGSANLKAGILVGSASVAALLMGATVMAPLMGMVALPFIQKKIQANKLKRAKPELQNAMNATITEVAVEVTVKLRKYIQDNVQVIQHTVQQEFENKLKERAQIMEEQLSRNAQQHGRVEQEKNQLTGLIQYLKGE